MITKVTDIIIGLLGVFIAGLYGWTLKQTVSHGRRLDTLETQCRERTGSINNQLGEIKKDVRDVRTYLMGDSE